MKALNKYIVLILVSLLLIDAKAQNDTSSNEDSENVQGVEEVDSKTKRKRTRHYVNFDLGMNNYITPQGGFPDANNELYSIKPFGSWYVGANSITKVNLMGPLFFEFGGGIVWYNFKFQNTKTRIVKGENEVEFFEDPNNYNDYKKSKLGATYLNIQALPGFEIGRDFRFYAGMYAGYRIGSRSKLVYNDGRKNRDIEKSNFFLNNVRYGLRAQLGIKDMDIFVNYDLNPLFIENRGPELQGISFGVIF